MRRKSRRGGEGEKYTGLRKDGRRGREGEGQVKD